ncbi:MAG: LacI family DNA-binding transcriptional regulator [Anaerolineales bacterium]|nr:LacI family DNA-binding transcriptional regulator [Anaerolineales bacterium]
MRSRKSTVTIQDVAREAGVSVSTVSRVLNKKDYIAVDTYEKVQQVIDELGYTSSLAARSMRSYKTNNVGLLIGDLKNPFAVEVMKGVDRAIGDFGYELIIHTTGKDITDLGIGWERRHVAQLNGSLTDGIIVVTPTTTNLPSAFPLVTIDPHVEESSFPSIISTNRAGALSVMEYLISLGHHRIGFIGGRPDLQSAIRRQQGYEDGLRQANISLVPDLIQSGDYGRKTGAECTRKLLSLPNPPTAIFAANDHSAIGAMEAAAEAGLRIPEDLSLVGFDNIPETAFTQPPMTTVNQSIEELGYMAAKILVDLIEGKSLESKIFKVPTELVIRKSCRAL